MTLASTTTHHSKEISDLPRGRDVLFEQGDRAWSIDERTHLGIAASSAI